MKNKSIVFCLIFSTVSAMLHSTQIIISGNIRIEAETNHKKCKKYVERISEAAVSAKEAYETGDEEVYKNLFQYIGEQRKKLKKCNKKQNDFWHKLGKIAPAGFLIGLTILF